MKYLVTCALLLLAAILRGALHPYYIVMSLPFLLIALAIFYRSDRSAAERRKRNRDRSKPGVIGPILTALLATALIIPATSLLAGALKPTLIYGFFYDLDHDGFMTRINTLKSAAVVDWSQIETLATERTDMPLPPDQMDQVEALVLEAMIGQARQAPNWPSKSNHYDRAIQWANDHEHLEPDLAIAEKENAQPKPTPLPQPTYTPLPPLPTSTPQPTYTPQAALPTYTPLPPQPTYTPIPTIAGLIRCQADDQSPDSPKIHDALEGNGRQVAIYRCLNDSTLYQVEWYPRPSPENESPSPYVRYLHHSEDMLIDIGDGVLIITVVVDGINFDVTQTIR